MIQASPVEPLAPIHYRHTSYLRGFDEEKSDQVPKNAPPFHPFHSLPFKRLNDISGDSLSRKARRVEGAPSDERRSKPDSEQDNSDKDVQQIDLSVPSPTTSSREEQMATTMASEKNLGDERSDRAANVEGRGGPTARKSLDKLNRPLHSPSSNSYRSPPRAYNVESYQREGSYDGSKEEREGTRSAKLGAEDEMDVGGGRLPGIAHLDRQMHTPWSASRLGGAGLEERKSSMHEDVQDRDRDFGLPVKRGEEEDLTWSRQQRRHGSVSDGPSPRMPPSQSAYELYSRRSFAHGGAYPSTERTVGGLPARRHGSPLDRDREYELHRAPNRYPTESGRPDPESVTWPSSPALRNASPSHLDASENTHGAEHRRWRTSMSDATEPYARGSGLPSSTMPKRGSGPSYPSYEQGTERSSLPPLASMRGVPGRYDAPPYQRSPPLRSSYDGRYRSHGGSGSSTSSGEHYSYGHRYPPSHSTGLLPPSSTAPSLRSLSMPYPYETGRGSEGTPYGAEPYRPYDDVDRYEEHRGIRHGSVGPMSPPRHHPYAGSASVHHGNSGAHVHGHHSSSSSSYTDAVAAAANAAGGGSPGSMPRRRGKLPKPVTDLLKTWLLDHAAHPYPTEDEKRRLCAATGLSISQVSNWFINARRRILVPQGSGHFGVAPSTTAMNAAPPSASGGKLAGSRHSPVPHGGMALHHHPHHQYAPGDSPQIGHRQQHHQHHHHHPPPPHHLGHAPPPSSRPHGSAALPPLGPPPLPSHHYRQDSYPRSAEQSPLLSRRHDSP